VAALIIRLPDGKRERLKDLARAPYVSVIDTYNDRVVLLRVE
jgi:hypothetical protein